MKFSSYRDWDFCKCPSDFRSTFKCRWKYTAISRKVVGKNVLATTPKGNMGYDQCTVLNDCSCRTFILLLLSISTHEHMSMAYCAVLYSIQNHPQIIPIGIVACFFPTTFLETAVCLKMFWQPLSTYEAIKKVTILVCCDLQLRDKVIIRALFDWVS